MSGAKGLGSVLPFLETAPAGRGSVPIFSAGPIQSRDPRERFQSVFKTGRERSSKRHGALTAGAAIHKPVTAGAADTRGFTLIELIISITLVAAIATGMMMALHTSLLSLEKIDSRLQLNRRIMGMEKILANQIGGVMPVVSDCGDKKIPIFLGTPDSLRLVTSYSLEAGARGYPQFDVFQVVRGEQGLRLVVTEHPYTGPSSTVSLCSSTQVTPSSIIVADRLASCVFSYREALPDQPPSTKWLPGWDNPNLLPAAVKIEMTPLDSSAALLPVVNVTVPIRITRQMRAIYGDQ